MHLRDFSAGEEHPDPGPMVARGAASTSTRRTDLGDVLLHARFANSQYRFVAAVHRLAHVWKRSLLEVGHGDMARDVEARPRLRMGAEVWSGMRRLRWGKGSGAKEFLQLTTQSPSATVRSHSRTPHSCTHSGTHPSTHSSSGLSALPRQETVVSCGSSI